MKRSRERLSKPDPPQAASALDSGALPATADFALLGAGLGRDVRSALKAALSEGAAFACPGGPLAIFRHALGTSIRDIEEHPRGKLFQEFLTKGPYEDTGEIPARLVDQRLSDAWTAAAITFICSYMVNSFKGAVAELLAAGACSVLLKRLQREGKAARDARLYVGDSVLIRKAKGRGFLKGADLHILAGGRNSDMSSGVAIAGVAEVKSYIRSADRLREQMDMHLRRARRGLIAGGAEYPGEQVTVGYGKGNRALRIAVLPSDWKLPRSFRFEDSENSRTLHVDRGEPPQAGDEITETGPDEWRITLKWSKEALAEAAYEMTFWYMAKVGEVVYSGSRLKSQPEGWEEMTPAEAGRNAAKMMLYYAILRCRSRRESQRAIALYNSYGFGYALGMSFKDAEGRREMLWPEDLDEILSAGKTKGGCAIR